MKTFYLTAILAVFLFICNNGLQAQTVQTDSPEKVEYYKVSEVRISISNPSDIMELRKQGLGFENMKLNDKSFDVMLDSYQISILKKTGYPYKILIDDVTKDYLERTKESREMLKTKKATMTSEFVLGSMGGFYTFSEVVAQLDSMRRKFPNLITARDSIGKTNEGRAIWAVKISDNPDVKENEPEVLYIALNHASQPLGMMTVMYFMHHLLENYGTDPEVTYLVNNRELYFVPVINPDGYVYNEQMSPNGGGLWGKNRRDNGGGLFGVNLINNYSYKWGIDDIGSSPKPQDRRYRGTAPFSEPETQAVRDFCLAHKFLISNSYFGYGEIVYPPWSYIHEETPDSSKFNRLIKLATVINGYTNAFSLPVAEFESVNGTSQDWMYGETNGKNRIFALDILVGNYIDGLWPAPGRIIPLLEENLYLNKVLAWGPGIIENLPYLSDGNLNPAYCNPKSDTLKYYAFEQNPENRASKVYAQILNSKDSVVSETLLTQTDSTFNGHLSFDASDEDFYTVRYRQNGTDIPSNFYYTDATKLKFTTVPLLIEKLDTNKISAVKYTVQPSVKNDGKSKGIPNLKINLASIDPWVKSISPAQVTLSYLDHGQTRKTSAFAISVDTTIFPEYFNLTFTIASNGYVYWTDTMKLDISTGIESISFLGNGLYQNYPNPFNSVTTINWQIAQNSKVTLKVLDIVGRTVATLVDEQRPQGKYETKYNAATLPKGIYFYQLKAGEYSQTRKMILMK